MCDDFGVCVFVDVDMCVLMFVCVLTLAYNGMMMVSYMVQYLIIYIS